MKNVRTGYFKNIFFIDTHTFDIKRISGQWSEHEYSCSHSFYIWEFEDEHGRIITSCENCIAYDEKDLKKKFKLLISERIKNLNRDVVLIDREIKKLENKKRKVEIKK